MAAPRILTTLGAVVLLATLAPACVLRSRPRPQGFHFESIRDGDREYPYAVYVPRNYDASREWPLVLFLHGSGESGTDGSKPIIQGIGSAVLWDAARWPAVIVFPQKPTEASEWEQHESALLGILERVRRAYRIDPSRITLTGLSQGGHGAWVLGARHPDLFAAIVPICGYASARREGADGLPPPFEGKAADLAGPLRGMPIWAFHGEADDVVPVSETKALVEAVRAAGGNPKVTLYPGVGHGCWDTAYREPGLAEWLLSQRKGAAH